MNENVEINKKAVFVQGVWFEGALIARILMQTIWITIWYQGLMGKRVDWTTSGIVIFLALSISTLLVRLFSMLRNWRRGLRTTIFTSWLVVFFLASLKWLVFPGEDLGFFQTIPFLLKGFNAFPIDYSPLWHIVLVFVLIWQGVNLGNSRGSLAQTIFGFKIGILLLLLYGLAFMPTINVVNSLPWLAYMVLGLLATSVNRIADLIPLRGGRLPSSTGIWWAAIFGVAVLLITISLTMSGVLNGVVRIGVFVSLAVILLPLGLIVGGFIFFLFFIAKWINPQINLSFEQVTDSVGEPLIGFIESDRLMKNWQKIGRHTLDEYILPAIVLFIIIIVIFFIFLDLHSNRSWIRRILLEESVTDVLDRFRQRSRDNRDLSGGKRKWQASRYFAAQKIRRIYARMMDLSDKVGSPRPKSQTPLEFLPTLYRVFPDQIESTRLITHSYLKIRYGGFPETLKEVEEVEAAWNSVRANGRTLILAKKQEDRDKLRR